MFFITTTVLSTLGSIGSLTLGVAAWILAGLAIASKSEKRAHGLSVGSFGLCVIPLVLQLFEIKMRSVRGDFAAIEDTIGAVIFASIVLVVVTIMLNVVAVLKHK